MGEAQNRYLKQRNITLDKENQKLRSTLKDLHTTNKYLWLALAITSLMTVIQSVRLW